MDNKQFKDTENPPDDYGSLDTVNLTKKRKYRDDEENSDCSWTNDVEDYIRDLLAKCEAAEKAHTDAGYEAKKLHARYAFPGMLIPTISAPIMGTFKDQDWAPYFGMGAMVVTAVFNGFSNFFNFGKKSQEHFNFAGRYGDIVTDIQESLAKHRNKRASGQVVMRTVKMRYDALSLSAPET